ncbi:bifunctional phosphopantothenoylcysteine decarboxylase/phosphopantothenate--cysteine ligase CoaBC [Salinirubrum litoreum]|uniref:Coenzyme A biosynthesis bifunctional protein CoaBC n=1 Tax=Salinirubrum litoreum TaxID=1126234 RepID=A0ABD5RB82_9EURY|nr:bifunctional phosphopantothenoylcysteine decarboxylase/phosphopantothenate--cysteine ligase CoaBC [Salinirubrum litoreum]
MLEGVNVALGVTGSIAAVKTVELAHELRRQGASVRAVMTDSARGILHPWAVEFATEHDVVTEITGRVEHVELCGREGWADVLLVAPATANTVGKIAGAVDDTPVTTCATTALGAGVPVVVAPAMHEPMYDHPGVLDALARLEEWGVTYADPRIEEGKAKIASEDAVVTELARATTPDSLADQHVVVTAGATSEVIDPIRTLTNRASGTTGRAVARACYVRGADVTLVHDGDDVHYADTRQVESAAEMLAAVQSAVSGNGATDTDGSGGGSDPDQATADDAPTRSESATSAGEEPTRREAEPTTTDAHDQPADALVSAAAISDFTVEAHDEKIRSGESLTLELEPTPKLLDTVRDEHPDLTMVGFKAETSGDDDAMVEAARSLRDRVGLAFVVANDASVMGETETRALFVDDADPTAFVGSKVALGGAVADRLAGVLV